MFSYNGNTGGNGAYQFKFDFYKDLSIDNHIAGVVWRFENLGEAGLKSGRGEITNILFIMVLSENT